MSRSRTVLLTVTIVAAAVLTSAAPASAAPAVAPHVRLSQLETATHEAVRLGFEALPEADRVPLPQILKNLDMGFL